MTEFKSGIIIIDLLINYSIQPFTLYDLDTNLELALLQTHRLSTLI